MLSRARQRLGVCAGQSHTPGRRPRGLTATKCPAHTLSPPLAQIAVKERGQRSAALCSGSKAVEHGPVTLL